MSNPTPSPPSASTTATTPPTTTDPISPLDAQSSQLAALSLQDYENGRIDDATRHLKHALALSPHNPTALLVLSTLRAAEANGGRLPSTHSSASTTTTSTTLNRFNNRPTSWDRVVELVERLTTTTATTTTTTTSEDDDAGTAEADAEADEDELLHHLHSPRIHEVAPPGTPWGGTILRRFLEAPTLSMTTTRHERGGRVISALLTPPSTTTKDSGARQELVSHLSHLPENGVGNVLRRFLRWSQNAGGNNNQHGKGVLETGFTGVVLDRSLWKDSVTIRERVVRGVFSHLMGLDTATDGKEYSTGEVVNALSKILIAETGLVASDVRFPGFGRLMDAIGRGSERSGSGDGSGSESGSGVQVATATLAVAKYLLETEVKGDPLEELGGGADDGDGEKAQGKGEQLLREYMLSNLLSLPSLRAATALFPLCQTVGGRLFSARGGEFVGSLVAELKRRKSGGGGGKGSELQVEVEVVIQILRLISAASAEKTCRAVIAQRCVGVLEEMVSASPPPSTVFTSEEVRGLAAVVLAKLQYTTSTQEGGMGRLPQQGTGRKVAGVGKGKGKGMEDLAKIFKTMVVKQGGGRIRDEAVEGLAYASLKIGVKEMLARDAGFLKGLVRVIEGEGSGSGGGGVGAGSGNEKVTAGAGVLFGALTVLANVVRYPPMMSEEQKKVAQLKRYARAGAAGGGKGPGGGGGAGDGDGDEEDDDEPEEAVTARCKKVIDAGAVAALAGLVKPLLKLISTSSGGLGSLPAVAADSATTNTTTTTPGMASLALVPTILLSLAHHQPYRPVIAQQGGVKLLLKIISALEGRNSGDSAGGERYDPAVEEAAYTSSHALARILVSVNPVSTFSNHTTPAETAIRPLVGLLRPLAVAEGVGGRNGFSRAGTGGGGGGGGAAAGGGNNSNRNLAAFEGLLALTNLATFPDEKVVSGVERLALKYLVPLDGRTVRYLGMGGEEGGGEAGGGKKAKPKPKAGKGGKGGKTAKDEAEADDDDDDEDTDEVIINPLILSSTLPAIQRAATELVCNFTGMGAPLLPTLVLYSMDNVEGVQVSKEVKGRLRSQAEKTVHILLALADVQDFRTRRAAVGALAGLFACVEGGMAGLVLRRGGRGVGGAAGGGTQDEQGRDGVEVLLGTLCDDGLEGGTSAGEGGIPEEDGDGDGEAEEEVQRVLRVPNGAGQRWEEMVARGVVCLAGLVDGGGKDAVERVRRVSGGVEVLKEVVGRGVKLGGRPWLGEAVRVLKAVM